jgi:hypothetical protein
MDLSYILNELGEDRDLYFQFSGAAYYPDQ